MIKWLWKKLFGKLESSLLMCDFCDEELKDKFIVEFDLEDLAAEARFHIDCFEENVEQCQYMIDLIAQAAIDRREEVLQKLTEKELKEKPNEGESNES